MDIGEQFRDSVIDNGANDFFHSLSSLRNTNHRFDLIVMNSVLYALDDPIEFLRYCKENLKEKGLGFWLDACFDVQPWIIPEIDARVLLTRDLIRNTLERNGFKILHDIYDGQGKDAGYIFRRTCDLKSTAQKNGSDLYKRNKTIYESNIDFINLSVELLLSSVEDYQDIGIYGTSLAGMYFFQLCKEHYPDRNIFFIDEQSEEIGVYHYDSIVVNPKDVGKALVILPFPQYVAADILQRMKRHHYLEDCKLVPIVK